MKKYNQIFKLVYIFASVNSLKIEGNENNH